MNQRKAFVPPEKIRHGVFYHAGGPSDPLNGQLMGMFDNWFDATDEGAEDDIIYVRSDLYDAVVRERDQLLARLGKELA